MKHVYIDSRLDSLALAVGTLPKEWIFSRGRPWLLLTPRRLARLAARLGLEDLRVGRLVSEVSRHAVTPNLFRLPLGLPGMEASAGGRFPLAICPVCDGVHRPHPLDAGDSCPECRRRRVAGERLAPTPRAVLDREADAAARQRIRDKDPGAFDDGVLSPNWKINRSRRLHRDWDAAVNRILMGHAYRRVAREFHCSVGLLHRRVTERRNWENN